ncbi:MAG: hypothetical protein QXU21_04980 [Candidatus Bathyarchaeia archaeon]
MSKETERSIIFCNKDGYWKKELDKKLETCEIVTLLALGDVKNELLRYLNRRKDIEILRMETRYMKKREKGVGLKVKVRSIRKSTTKSK